MVIIAALALVMRYKNSISLFGAAARCAEKFDPSSLSTMVTHTSEMIVIQQATLASTVVFYLQITPLFKHKVHC